ncbi:hypothetical protein [Bacillus haynesii]|uniref:hypothetical protein n=1 Tax=Bacillus haynesii TaxID=1925021 RepID=UPI002DBA3451|nr:hypothetical protein [Bacillus haynesii]MEC1562468.1 hypothetical protein [Bacillus haynesii]
MSEFKSTLISVDNSSATGEALDFFVVTGSPHAPIVCLANNNGYPPVRDIYARTKIHQNKRGVHVTVRLEGTATGTELTINLAQPDMEGDYTVIPL